MIRHDYWVVLAVLAAGTAAHAEPAALTAAADPAQKTPPITYQSPFAGDRAFQVLPPEPWPQVNDRVREIGGHMGSLQNDNAAPGAAPAGDEHDDHHR